MLKRCSPRFANVSLTTSLMEVFGIYAGLGWQRARQIKWKTCCRVCPHVHRASAVLDRKPARRDSPLRRISRHADSADLFGRRQKWVADQGTNCATAAN